VVDGITCTALESRERGFSMLGRESHPAVCWHEMGGHEKIPISLSGFLCIFRYVEEVL